MLIFKPDYYSYLFNDGAENIVSQSSDLFLSVRGQRCNLVEQDAEMVLKNRRFLILHQLQETIEAVDSN
jgi:hypothetical protein